MFDYVRYRLRRRAAEDHEAQVVMVSEIQGVRQQAEEVAARLRSLEVRVKSIAREGEDVPAASSNSDGS